MKRSGKRSVLFAAALAGAMLVSGVTAASADCRLNGRSYSVGVVVGSLVCTPKGWAPRGR